MHNDVIVVGAGIAGLGAARILADAGYEVLVCEARSQIGGRIQSWVRDRTHVVELGAEFIHGDAVSTWAIVSQLQLQTHVHARWDGRMVWNGDRLERSATLAAHYPQVARLHSIEDEIAAYTGPEISVAQWLDSQGYTGVARHLADVRLSHSAATSPAQQSLYALQRDIWASEPHGGQDHHILAGYSQIVYHLADGIPIWCDTAVTAISDDGHRCHVALADGRQLTANYVLVTVPLAVLQADMIAFAPALSHSKVHAINVLEMQGGLKVILQFAQPFWPPDMSFLTLDDPAPVWWTPQIGSSLLVGFFTGARAASLRNVADPIALCVAHLQNAFAVTQIPPLQWSHIEDWSADPWIRGAYSSVPVGAHGMRTHLAASHGRVYFAGEATALDGQAASVHGALNSGIREAHALLKALGYDA